MFQWLYIFHIVHFMPPFFSSSIQCQFPYLNSLKSLRKSICQLILRSHKLEVDNSSLYVSHIKWQSISMSLTLPWKIELEQYSLQANFHNAAVVR